MEVSLLGNEIQIKRPAGLLHTSPINVGESERVASGIAGAMLVLYGLRKGTIGGVLAALAGTSLLFRGVTGHCEVNELVGRNSASLGTRVLSMFR